MKKKVMLMFAVALIAAAAIAATTYTAIDVPEVGEQDVAGVSVVKPILLEGFGIVPTNGTVTISRIVGTTTNEIATATATNGAFNAEVSGVYLLKGDVILRSGTATNGVVRFICSGE